MELHELHIHQTRTGLVGQCWSVTVVLVVTRRVTVVNRCIAACRQHDDTGIEHDELAYVEINTDRTLYCAVIGQQ